MFILSFCAEQDCPCVLTDTVYNILHVFLVLSSDDSSLVYTNTEFRVCAVTVQGIPLSSCLVLPASHTRAVMFVTLQYFRKRAITSVSGR
jgi:hypothetical protein